MIDEKKIEEAADKHMLEQFYSKGKAEYPIECGEIDRQCQKDFKAGIDWFKKNLWHDAKDNRPNHNALCLCYDKFYKQCRVLMYNDNDKYWCDALLDKGEHVSDYGDYRITHWLYIDDLTKGGK